MNTFDRWGETILGAIVAVVAISFFAFAAAQAGQSTGGGANKDYVARFQRVDGIAVGSDVRVSGVKVGVVRTVALDPDTYMARLTLAVDPAVNVLDQSTARVMTDGLLGGAYVSIEPAGMDPLPAGGEITNTQGPVDFLTLMSSAVSGMSGNNQDSNRENRP